MKKYGKSYGNIAQLKNSFVTDNMKHLRENKKIAEIYKQQPKREKCKICKAKINNNKVFYSHGIQYSICESCGHINGSYEETDDFTHKIYENINYGKNYHVESLEIFYKRMEEIYVPKVRVMEEIFEEKSIEYKDLKYLDVGAGSGYFVGALRNEGLIASGIEISSIQVEYGNKMLANNYLRKIDENLTPEYILESKEDVVSFIGVLEHVVNLDEILDSLSKNKNVKYIYFSVPMFSYSVMWEATHPNVFNRLLGGAHTHIFSNESIKYLCKLYGWEIMGEWRFGTDIADLLRTITVTLKNSGNVYLSEIFEEKSNTILDDIQLLIDKSDFCSEIHLLVRK